jgi:hypothetical protein
LWKISSNFDNQREYAQLFGNQNTKSLKARQRKNFYTDLLQQATLTLKSNGAARICSDADVNNVPMSYAFQRAGYRQFMSRREYRLDYAKGEFIFLND